jgi:anti-anti-sigma factor
LEPVVFEYRPGALPALQAAVLGALDAGATEVVLDLDAIPSLDNAGVRGLISLLRRSRDHGGELGLRTTNPGVRKTLREMALDRIFSVTPAEAA